MRVLSKIALNFCFTLLSAIWMLYSTPIAAQSDVRMREMDRDSSVIGMPPVLIAVAKAKVDGELYRGDDEGAFLLGARKDCPSDAHRFCEELASISRESLRRDWNVSNERGRRVIVVSIDRATTDGGIDWSKAEALRRDWDYQQAERAAKQRRAQQIEANCALDTWTETHGALRRTRSRVYCW